MNLGSSAAMKDPEAETPEGVHQCCNPFLQIQIYKYNHTSLSTNTNTKINKYTNIITLPFLQIQIQKIYKFTNIITLHFLQIQIYKYAILGVYQCCNHTSRPPFYNINIQIFKYILDKILQIYKKGH